MPTRDALIGRYSNPSNLDLIQVVSEGGAITTALSASGASDASSPGVLPVFGFYLFSVSDGITVATNNSTGLIDFSGLDAAVVIRAAIGNMPNGGVLLFKNGVYNLNSLVLETTGGFSNYYAIGIPSGGPSNYAEWLFEGENRTPIVDQFGALSAQNTGVVFKVTTTAENSVAPDSPIFAMWARPDVISGIGATVRLKNLTLRFPTNTRGSETAVDLTQALQTDYEFVTVDFDVPWASIGYPVAGSHGLYGVTSTAGEKESNRFKSVTVKGYDVGFDIQTDQSVLENVVALGCNHAIDYAVRGPGVIFNNSSWVSAGWGECSRGLTIGTNAGLGTSLTIMGLGIEDANPATHPAFVPVYHIKEINEGNTSGFINYSIDLQETGPVHEVPWIFDGGGGSGFLVCSNIGYTCAAPFTIVGNTAIGPATGRVQVVSDSFTRANENPLSGGGNWSVPSGSTALQIVSNKVEAIVTSTVCLEYWSARTWESSQYSTATVGTLSGAGGTADIYTGVRLQSGAESGYILQISTLNSSAAIIKLTAGAAVTLTSIEGLTINSGDTFTLQVVGAALSAYHNGQSLLTTSDATYSSGSPGIGIDTTVLANATLSAWSGGYVQGLTLAASIAASANAGSATLPESPLGFLTWNLNGTNIKIPYYGE